MSTSAGNPQSVPQSLARLLTSSRRRIQSWFVSPWFAYISIIVLQLRRVWDAWKFRDLTTGDTSSYFIGASAWANGAPVNLLWSPLYTMYYGIVFDITGRAYSATLIHRLLIVLALACLVLALLRSLLPAEIAWITAAWWVVLPINFNSLYEVHLFAVLLPLAAAVLVLRRPGKWARGGALAILFIDALLVRNEMAIAAGLWGLACLIWEVRALIRHPRRSVAAHLLAYGLPLLAAALAFGVFYARALNRPSREEAAVKHTLNVCQVYAFGYQQRYSDWTGSPWTECQSLMVRDFGKPLVSIVEAARMNPQAMLEHLSWNLRLLPAGLQLALFNASSFAMNPDYIPVALDQRVVLLPSVALLAVGLGGAIALYKKRQFWWHGWLKERIWGWIMLLCLSAVMVIVIPVQRPRPSYMFLLTITLMAAIGMSVFAAIRRIRGYARILQVISGAMIVLPLLVGPYYTSRARPLLTLYSRLLPFAEYLGVPGTAIITSGYGWELCNYFAQSSAHGGCIGYTYRLFDGKPPPASVGGFLESQPVPVVAIYVDESFSTLYGLEPSMQAFLSDPKSEGWMLVSLQDWTADSWRLYVNTRWLDAAVP